SRAGSRAGTPAGARAGTGRRRRVPARAVGAGTVRPVGTARDARAALWARYDAGELGTDELDARLRAVDRAGDDPAALAQALTGPVRTPRPGRRRALPGVAVVAAVALGGI